MRTTRTPHASPHSSGQRQHRTLRAEGHAAASTLTLRQSAAEADPEPPNSDDGSPRPVRGALSRSCESLREGAEGAATATTTTTPSSSHRHRPRDEDRRRARADSKEILSQAMKEIAKTVAESPKDSKHSSREHKGSIAREEADEKEREREKEKEEKDRSRDHHRPHSRDHTRRENSKEHSRGHSREHSGDHSGDHSREHSRDHTKGHSRKHSRDEAHESEKVDKEQAAGPTAVVHEEVEKEKSGKSKDKGKSTEKEKTVPDTNPAEEETPKASRHTKKDKIVIETQSTDIADKPENEVQATPKPRKSKRDRNEPTSVEEDQVAESNTVKTQENQVSDATVDPQETPKVEEPESIPVEPRKKSKKKKHSSTPDPLDESNSVEGKPTPQGLIDGTGSETSGDANEKPEEMKENVTRVKKEDPENGVSVTLRSGPQTSSPSPLTVTKLEEEALAEVVNTVHSLSHEESPEERGIDPELHESIEFLQALIITRFTKKLYTKTRDRENIEQHRIKEILVTEESYLSDLKIVMRYFMTPLTNILATSPQSTIPNAVSEGLATLVPIIQFTVSFLAAMQHEETAMHVAQTFLNESFSNIMAQTYHSFFIHHPPLVDCVLTARKKLPELDAFIKQQVKQVWVEMKRKVDLLDLLITPVQRVLRYKMLLDDLLKGTPPSESHYSLLKAAAAKLSDIADEMNRTQGPKAIISTPQTIRGIDVTAKSVDPGKRVWCILAVEDRIWCGCDDSTIQLYDCKTHELETTILTDAKAASFAIAEVLNVAAGALGGVATMELIANISKSPSALKSAKKKGHKRNLQEKNAANTVDVSKRVWCMSPSWETGHIFCGMGNGTLIAVDIKTKSVIARHSVFSAMSSVQCVEVTQPGIVWCASAREGSVTVCELLDGNIQSIGALNLGRLPPFCMCYVKDPGQVWIGSSGILLVCCAFTNTILFRVSVFDKQPVSSMASFENKVWCVIGGTVVVWQPASKRVVHHESTPEAEKLHRELMQPQVLSRVDISAADPLNNLQLVVYPGVVQLFACNCGTSLTVYDAQTLEKVAASCMTVPTLGEVQATKFGSTLATVFLADGFKCHSPASSRLAIITGPETSTGTGTNTTTTTTNTTSTTASPTGSTAESSSATTTPAITITPASTASTSTSEGTSTSTATAATGMGELRASTRSSSFSYGTSRHGELHVWSTFVEGPALLVVFKIWKRAL
ncbi:RhoGEF domain [Pelomyxa schiedti]|nr:RhoGEF domain [Pelomyxa schiedti]